MVGLEGGFDSIRFDSIRFDSIRSVASNTTMERTTSRGEKERAVRRGREKHKGREGKGRRVAIIIHTMGSSGITWGRELHNLVRMLWIVIRATVIPTAYGAVHIGHPPFLALLVISPSIFFCFVGEFSLPSNRYRFHHHKSAILRYFALMQFIEGKIQWMDSEAVGVLLMNGAILFDLTSRRGT